MVKIQCTRVGPIHCSALVYIVSLNPKPEKREKEDFVEGFIGVGRGGARGGGGGGQAPPII